MNVKKQYEELIAYLEENKNRKVASILEDIYKICESKTKGRTFAKNDKGDIIAIYCYYHKQWEMLDTVEYGLKKSSSTGFNTMCKRGVRGWTQTQTQLKNLETELLSKVIAGEIETSDIKEIKEQRSKEIELKVAQREDVIETNFVEENFLREQGLLD